MNKKDLIELFENWREDGENERIVEAVLALPESVLDDDVLNQLVEAYLDIGEYKKAIAVLESQRPRLEDDYRWHFRMAVALYRASEDEECEEDDELRVNILTRAKVALARGMNMNPPEETLENADRYMELIEEELDELRGEDDDSGEDEDPELYEEEELDAVEEHIKEYYGDFPTVFHEIVSPDIHCDICIVPPTKERNYYTLLTMGMGAHIMDIPEDLSVEEHGRAELLICLPPDWKVGENAEEWFWPIALLKNLARLPGNTASWLGWGHSVDNQQPFAPNTGLCGTLLVYPEDVEPGAEECLLPNGDAVNFFEVIPIYREEMDFKIDNDARALLERMNSADHVVGINRANSCEGYKPAKSSVIDSSEYHSSKIAQKKLPLDKINGCNHMAIFLRWCVEHDLVAPEFHKNCPDVIEGVLSGKQTDLREFINEYFGGDLEMYQFSFLGAGFAHFYYNEELEDPRYLYPADVDDYAEKYFGTERYNSGEFQDEAYLFVPFDEEYYRGMSKYIERAYFEFYPGFAEYQLECGKKVFAPVEKALNLPGILPRHPEYIPQEYRIAAAEAKEKNYSAMIIAVDDSCAIESQEELTEMLEDALNPFLEPIVIVRITSHDFSEWINEHFSAEPPAVMPGDEYTESLKKRAEKQLGAIPAVLTYDEEKTTLFMPLDEGKYIRLTGEGIL